MGNQWEINTSCIKSFKVTIYYTLFSSLALEFISGRLGVVLKCRLNFSKGIISFT